MDRKTQRHLSALSHRVFNRHDMRSLVEEKPVYSEEEKRQVREMYNKTKSPRHRAALRQILTDGSLEATRSQINQQKQQEMDARMERRVKNDIRAGRITPAREDAFMRKLRRRR